MLLISLLSLLVIATNGIVAFYWFKRTYELIRKNGEKE